MVWNSEQSPLYQSVEKFNGGSRRQPEPQETFHEAPEPSPEVREQPRCKPEPPHGEFRSAAGSGNFIQRITSDRDFMLIAALILLLWQEKADMKIIAALAFVLLA